MPEGPEIRRAADAVSDAILGKTALEVRFGLEPLKRFEPLPERTCVVEFPPEARQC